MNYDIFITGIFSKSVDVRYRTCFMEVAHNYARSLKNIKYVVSFFKKQLEFISCETEGSSQLFVCRKCYNY